MMFVEYLEEKIFFIIISLIFTLFLSIYLLLIGVNASLIILLAILIIVFIFISLLVSYLLIKKRYVKIVNLVDSLDEKYLIKEVIDKPKNLENKAYYYALDKACKALNDKLSEVENSKNEYLDFLDSFIHEVKTPISALALYADNNNDERIKEEVLKISRLVDKMLFYARSDVVEKDYFIKEVSLADLVHPAILEYKNYLLNYHIKVEVKDLDNLKVYTDIKWLNFIIGQIISNSLKYQNKKDRLVRIKGVSTKNNIKLEIYDNGVGIKEADISKVFEKGFTGSNRNKKNASGIGLYLTKKLCDKLGIDIKIESVYLKYTKVVITFPKGNYFIK
ncbi:MAG TPA: sensor histidine kinase [Candidatus Onthousia excrementipullorum]|uniref:histidine kinase n=1 Tax=Candidatus Onthousia excrementipullorum TaxID=2840884 RepID=A0A9D1DTY8_9FIRM|nr:sensor histidine kinase [Candidatus Onthousia excrementipullorum]